MSELSQIKTDMDKNRFHLAGDDDVDGLHGGQPEIQSKIKKAKSAALEELSLWKEGF